MKKFLCLFLFFIHQDIFSQSHCGVVKVYAYQRTSLPGTVPKRGIDEKGIPNDRMVKSRPSYFIYLEYKPSRMIRPSLIWIDNKPFDITTEKIISTPVILIRQGVGESIISDTLINQTSNEIVRIQPKGPASLTSIPSLNKKLKKSKIVIEYYLRNKKHYYAINDFKNLQPVAMQ